MQRALSAEFDVFARKDRLRAHRRRSVPTRGVLRLLIPRVVVTVSKLGTVRVRPDALAWFMGLMVLGAVVVELSMDRVKYPREYPVAFPFALALGWALGLAWEWKKSNDRARALLGK
ncbi:MAG: hypothetical protein IPJ65_33640 [Archangiaceae bacterium]|nr:hypothetical protein [Archangiaceae bacterium]